jgi:NitT/TauT family transport system substrate-binding protein
MKPFGSHPGLAGKHPGMNTMKPLSRRSALQLLAAPAIAGATDALPAAAQSSPVRFACGASNVGASGFYALDGGFFTKAGLNATAANFANGAAIAAAILSGDLEFGSINTVALASARQNNVPLVWVAPNGAYTSKSPTAAIVVAKASPIRTAKDLEGKTVAVFLLKQLADIAVHSWLENNGADADKLKYVEMPYSPMDAALLSGRIDAACIEEPVLSQTLASNGRLLAYGYDAIAPLFCEGAWATSASYAQSNPAIIKRFADAIARTAGWANTNRAATTKILEKYSQAPVPQGMHYAYFPSRMKPEYFQPVVDAAERFGVIKQRFNVLDMFAPGIA